MRRIKDLNKKTDQIEWNSNWHNETHIKHNHTA